jgi:hypothetical protein
MNFLQESNFERRAFTKQKREEQLLNQNKKVIPRKVIIVDNDATKKLAKIWDKGSFLEKGDRLGKIKLDPTPNGYGKTGVYGVWESVKGKSGMYADVKTIDGVKWSFTELWLDEEGAKKLQNNIVPLRTDFERSSDKSLSNYKERRRLNALKDKNKTGEQQLKQDIINYKNNYSDGFLSKHPNISAYNFTDDSKKVTRENEVYKNLEKIVEPLKKYIMDNKDASKIYWSMNDIIKIKDTKERAAAIDNLKKEVNNFLKNNKKQTYFNY